MSIQTRYAEKNGVPYIVYEDLSYSNGKTNRLSWLDGKPVNRFFNAFLRFRNWWRGRG